MGEEILLLKNIQEWIPKQLFLFPDPRGYSFVFLANGFVSNSNPPFLATTSTLAVGPRSGIDELRFRRPACPADLIPIIYSAQGFLLLGTVLRNTVKTLSLTLSMAFRSKK